MIKAILLTGLLIFTSNFASARGYAYTDILALSARHCETYVNYKSCISTAIDKILSGQTEEQVLVSLCTGSISTNSYYMNKCLKNISPTHLEKLESAMDWCKKSENESELYTECLVERLK